MIIQEKDALFWSLYKTAVRQLHVVSGLHILTAAESMQAHEQREGYKPRKKNEPFNREYHINSLTFTEKIFGTQN